MSNNGTSVPQTDFDVLIDDFILPTLDQLDGIDELKNKIAKLSLAT